MPKTTIYKLVRLPEWSDAQKAGIFRGSPDDLRDGFLHFSESSQLRATAEKHFKDQADLVLLAVDAARLGPALVWEISRGGDTFPHFYGALALDAIASVHRLPRDADGMLVFPDEIF